MKEKLDLVGIQNHIAGSKGFVESKYGHFYIGDERIRFFGTNICMGACFPEASLAKEIVDHLKQHGFNAVRLHHMDWNTEVGIFKDSKDNTLILDDEKLDKMDYFISLLEESGIYINFNTHVSRQFAKNDGMPDYDKILFAGKFINYFDDHAKALHKDYIKKLLDRENKYTGKKYKNDPGICMIEISNENWIYYGWMSGFLHTNKNQSESYFTWSVPQYYLDKLDKKWNIWLKKCYKTTKNLLEKWSSDDTACFLTEGDYKSLGINQTIEAGNINRLQWDNRNKYPHAVLEDNAKFYNEIERAYFVEVLDYLKIELGFRVPVTTTSGYFANPTLFNQTVGDYTDTHFYVDNMGSVGEDFGMKGISIIRDNVSNSGIESAGMYNFIASCALSKVKDMPLSISEYNVSFPSKYEYEIHPVLTSYALYQDWDALFQFGYGHDLKHEYYTKEQPLLSSLDLVNNDMKMAQSAICAQMFIRGDIKIAKKTITAKYNNQEMFSLLNSNESWSYNRVWDWNFDLKGPFPFVSIYKYKFEREYNQKYTSIPSELFEAREYDEFFNAKEHISDDNQLKWYGYDDKNYLIIESEKTQGVVGFIKNKEIKTKNATIKMDKDCSILLTANDNSNLIDSKNITICISVGQYNTNQKLNEQSGFNKGDWGEAPLCQDKISGKLQLRTNNEKVPSVVALDRHGYIIKDLPANNRINGFISVDIFEEPINIIKIIF